MADDRIVISSEPSVTPDDVARRSFPVVFRGYDQDEVRRLLKKVAEELRAARERELELHRSMDEARSQLAHPELDEATLTAALGEETTRILRSAREAAADMRTKAEERVARMVQEADEHGARLRLEAENLLARRVEEADEVAANIRTAAEADARAVHDQVQTEIEAARARGKEMVAEAHAVRERVISDLARRRRAAQIQIEQLLAGRDRLLDSYTTVRRTLDEVTAELAHAEDEARMAAEAAQRRAAAAPPDDTDLQAMVSAPEPPVAPEPVPPPTTTAPFAPQPAPAPPAQEAEQPRPSLVRLQPLDEEEGVRVIGPVQPPSPPAPAPAPAPTPFPAPGPPGADARPVFLEPDPPAEGSAPTVVEEGDVPESDTSAPPETEARGHGGSVEDLFARLRAERQAAVTRAEEVLAPSAAAPVEAASAEAGEATAGPEGTEGGAADGVDARADHDLLERRDEFLRPVTTDLVRRLKRVLQDEQNEILDQLRKGRGRTRPEDALPPAADQAGRYRDAATGPLVEAARSGASFTGGASADDVSAGQWAQALADELVGGLRDRISRSVAGDETDEGSDAVDSLGAAYRQWKTERIDQIARHHLAAAFNQGVLAGAPAGATLRWVFGDPGPCPDCDDNALAGPTPKGEVYPTGQLHPPAHAGCGCLLALADGQSVS